MGRLLSGDVVGPPTISPLRERSTSFSGEAVGVSRRLLLRAKSGVGLVDDDGATECFAFVSFMSSLGNRNDNFKFDRAFAWGGEKVSVLLVAEGLKGLSRLLMTGMEPPSVPSRSSPAMRTDLFACLGEVAGDCIATDKLSILPLIISNCCTSMLDSIPKFATKEL